MYNDLKGKFHAHITLLTDEDDFVAPKGWKTTIILLKKGDREQKDVMITRHYHTDTSKTRDVVDMIANIRETATALQDCGHHVIRQKLEHESLPTVPVSEQTYRECHIKIKKKVGEDIFVPDGFVMSSNPMEEQDDHEIVFLNARYYSGDIESIHGDINTKVDRLVGQNNRCGKFVMALEVKIESTVFDTNLGLDKWWA